MAPTSPSAKPAPAPMPTSATLASARGRIDMEVWFAHADANADHRLSKSEAAIASPELADRFKSLDRDQDGYIAFDEFAASYAAP